MKARLRVHQLGRTRWFIMLILAGMAVPAVWFSVGCQSVPVSGRKRLAMAIPRTVENQMGLMAYQEVKSTETVSPGSAQQELVRRVGERIARVADQADFDWEFTLFESDTQNAFCLPGGKVAVYSGILPVCETEAGLAVVMSHEIAHAIARHGGERMQQKYVQLGGQKATEFMTRRQSEEKQKIILAAYGGATEYGVILPFSRTHELEADEIGLMLMARAGYDPAEAPRFWERFAGQKTGEAPMEFLSTHPSDERRAASLRALLPKAQQLYDTAPEKLGLGARLALPR